MGERVVIRQGPMSGFHLANLTTTTTTTKTVDKGKNKSLLKFLSLISDVVCSSTHKLGENDSILLKRVKKMTILLKRVKKKILFLIKLEKAICYPHKVGEKHSLFSQILEETISVLKNL